MWLTSSSIGRKFVMALTGVCLVLFVTFHVLMNTVAVFSPVAYNKICMMLGANWYAVVASLGLAALFIIHILYAIWLTVQNRKARGADRYAVTSRPPQVEWSSKNMLVLGFVIVAFLVVHLIQFWYKMQFTELVCNNPECWAVVGGAPAAPEFGTLYLQSAFSHILTLVVYLVAFVALWLHMNHGFWSMFQTVGWNNKTWLPRLKAVAKGWTSLVVVLFVLQAFAFTYMARENMFLTDPELQAQYAGFWDEQAEKVIDSYEIQTAQIEQLKQQGLPTAVNEAEFLNGPAQELLKNAETIMNYYNIQCSEVATPTMAKLQDVISQIKGNAVFSETADCCMQACGAVQGFCPDQPCCAGEAEIVTVTDDDSQVTDTVANVE